MKEENVNSNYGQPRIKEPTGGLAEVSAVRCSDGRRTVRLGNARLLDIVSTGGKKILVYKGSKRDPVRADVQDLMALLDRLVSEPGKG